MIVPMKIDFVSDVSCPWCIIGLKGLEAALARTSDTVDARITFQPFELNPIMPKGGQNIVEHVAEKYGSTAEQSDANRTMIIARAAELSFTMAMSSKSRIYNTFDAHRLLHWAGIAGRQASLKHALFAANFTENRDVADHTVLIAVAERAGLDGVQAAAILSSDRYADDVREAEGRWRSRGISAVPAIIINDKHLISGGQPIGVFEEILRKIAAAS